MDNETLNDLVQEMIVALSEDLETGSHYFNNAAHEMFVETYPRFSGAMNKLTKYVNDWYNDAL